MNNNISKVKKIKTTTKAELKGFVIGCLIVIGFTIGFYENKIANIKEQYSTSNATMQIKANSTNLLYQEGGIESLLINSLSEVHIADDIQQYDNNSNLASTTINIANNKNKNSLISDTITRAEVREDGSLIKIIDVNDIIYTKGDLIKPNSIESFIIDFPISNNAKELKIEVFSDVISKPISAKTFNLSTNES